ncbi:MAG: cobalamin-independent methionine synthase II family protein [Bacteroidetes bacterium]|nr:cobalamin-independent methionine synthase II family protein [Bacteroidota bacterium]
MHANSPTDKPPTIKTTVVGSYPMIDWLARAPSRQALQDATTVVLQTQERAGLDVVADGELYRFDINHPETNGMIDYFVRPLENIRHAITRADVQAFQKQKGMGFRKRPAAFVEGPLGPGTLDLVDDYRRVRALTQAPLKFTITGPHMLSKTLLDAHYREGPALAHALADVMAEQVREIDAEIVQFDEANITGSPDEAEWAAGALNGLLDAVPGTPAVHLCFGNYGGQSIQRGTWQALIDYINRLHVDHMVLEFAFRGYDEVQYLKDVRPEIGLGIGVIDIKTTLIESPDEVARRIETAARVVGVERIKYVHPDCGFWMLQRSIADGKMRALVEGRDLFEGRDA